MMFRAFARIYALALAPIVCSTHSEPDKVRVDIDELFPNYRIDDFRRQKFEGAKSISSMMVGPCDCHATWALCTEGWGEDGPRGCGNTGRSCAEICPGDLPWKGLYSQTVARETLLEAECGKNPTQHWGPNNASTNGPFAVAFSG